MAAVLTFPMDRLRDRRRPEPSGEAAGADATRGLVVIFPGVRIVRHDPDLSRHLVPRPGPNPARRALGEDVTTGTGGDRHYPGTL